MAKDQSQVKHVNHSMHRHYVDVEPSFMPVVSANPEIYTAMYSYSLYYVYFGFLVIVSSVVQVSRSLILL